MFLRSFPPLRWSDIIYLFPAAIDLLLGSFFFIASVRMAQSGATAFAVSMTMVVWGISYMVLCPIVGRIVSPSNCVRMLITSSCAMALCALAFIFFPELKLVYVIMGVFGATVAFFFPPFMVFMKDFTSGSSRRLSYSIALYTVAWSSGLALGPFISGFLWHVVGWTWVCGLDCALALASAVGIFLINRRRTIARQEARSFKDPLGAAYTGYPNLIIVSWIGAGGFLLALSMVRGVFPSSAAAHSIPEAHQGNALALICFTQAAMAWSLRQGKTWFYRPLPIAIAGISGLVGLALFGLASTWVIYYLAAICVGCCSGAVYNYLVFHALVHPHKSGQYAGMNESIVGFAGIVGPLVGGVVADKAGLRAPYIFAAGVFLCVLGFQLVLLCVKGKKVRASRGSIPSSTPLSN